MNSGDEIERVIEEHLRSRQESGPVRRLSRDRLRSLMSLLGRGPSPDQATTEILELVSLLGVGEEVRRELIENADEARALGIEFREAFPIMQAYSRATARIVEAEATLARQLVRQRPEAERAEYLERLLRSLLPLGVRGFEVIHAALFHARLLDELAPDQLEEHEGAPMWVALVDLCGSTPYLASAGTEEAEQLVDALFEAGQVCVQGRQVRVVKYVGDGVFLVGRDATDIALASFDALDRVAARLPVPARAGVAHGPLLRRSGDYFGLAVNQAQLLTKVAREGTVVTTSDAAEHLPRELHGRARRVRIRGWNEQLEVVALRRPSER